MSRWIAAGVVVVVLAACSGGPSRRPTPSASALPRGGTLRVLMPPLVDPLATGAPALDPQGETFIASGELFRCCLARSLLGYNGQSTEQGGAEVRPDLASAMPAISPDGLTWTFHLKRDLHYAPPLQQVVITSQDVVRGIERSLRSATCPGCYASLIPDVTGAPDYAAGRSDTIAGLETPTSTTLVVHLTAPAGDLGNRLAAAPVVPVPPSPTDPSSPFGVATGHDQDYGRFLVSSGPYMLEGADAVDFSQAPTAQQPASGFVPGHSITLVRNPSWHADSDPLRPAYPDRIEITMTGTIEADAAKVDAGAADLVFSVGPPPRIPLDQFNRYQSDPSLRQRLHVNTTDFVRVILMNLALPPFDDVHVRKAVSYAIDKDRLLKLRGGPAVGQIAGHIFLDSVEDNLLVDYDPYRTSSRAEAMSKAADEMRQSGYDSDHDGRCDAPACQHVKALTPPLQAVLIKAVEQDLHQIGIAADIVSSETIFDTLEQPTTHVALGVSIGLGIGPILNGSGIASYFTASALDDKHSGNWSLVGASPQQLRRWRYSVRSVPGVDAKYNQCLPLTGQAQFRCWAEMDQQLMEQVVPWVPLVFEALDQVVSARVVSYSFDQSNALPALDRIALKPGSD